MPCIFLCKHTLYQQFSGQPRTCFHVVRLLLRLNPRRWPPDMKRSPLERRVPHRGDNLQWLEHECRLDPPLLELEDRLSRYSCRASRQTRPAHPQNTSRCDDGQVHENLCVCACMHACIKIHVILSLTASQCVYTWQYMRHTTERRNPRQK